MYTLHSSMQSSDQRRIFLRPTNGKRKIVLSTNLAETSITIDDIVYVIDSGKVKVKSYDTLTGVTALKAEWIPQVKWHLRFDDGLCVVAYNWKVISLFPGFNHPEKRKSWTLPRGNLFPFVFPRTFWNVWKVSAWPYSLNLSPRKSF